MKKRSKYIIILTIILFVLVLILIYYIFRYNEVLIVNKSNELLNDLKGLKPGEYNLKNGIVYNDNIIVSDKKYIYGNGIIVIDKYNNIKFLIDYKGKCISKTALGNISVINGMCNSFKKINVKMVKNNNNISFVSEEKLEYKVSSNDDFSGEFIKSDYKDSIIINSYNEGINYIWFKDSLGNISEPIKFSVDCLNTNKANYDSSVFYCSLSTVILDDIEWIVISDNNSDITLMKKTPLDEKMSYSDNEEFRWSSSSINYYLNNIFINKLSNDIRNRLIEFEICDDFINLFCNDEICGGMNKSEIIKHNYSCNRYTKSKVKLISYDEFNYAYSKGKSLDILKGNYLAINSIENGYVSSIQYDNSFYVLNRFNDKLDIKPVILLKK